jgi:hypothetical protein
MSDPSTMKGLAIAEKLWSLLGFSDTLYDEVDVYKFPLTFNYKLNLGGSAPKSQLYLPVQGKSGDFVADALTTSSNIWTGMVTLVAISENWPQSCKPLLVLNAFPAE